MPSLLRDLLILWAAEFVIGAVVLVWLAARDWLRERRSERVVRRLERLWRLPAVEPRRVVG